MWPIYKNKERIQKFIKTGNADFIYKNELDKAFFQHDMAYCKSEDLQKIIQSDKVSRDKAFKIAKNPKNDSYQRGLASIVYKFFDKKFRGSSIIVDQIISWQKNFISQLLKNLRKEKFIHPLDTTFGE